MTTMLPLVGNPVSHVHQTLTEKQPACQVLAPLLANPDTTIALIAVSASRIPTLKAAALPAIRVLPSKAEKPHASREFAEEPAQTQRNYVMALVLMPTWPV
jgi:hypothetical protein